MRTTWKVGALKDFATQVSTGPFGSMLHKSDYAESGVPLINPTNIMDDSIVPDRNKQLSGAALKRLANYVLRPGDVLVGRRGEIGRCAVIGPNEAGWICGTGCFFIRPSSSLDSNFLAQLLRSPMYRTRLECSSTGATMKNVSNDTLASLEIAIPPLPEQQRIVAILDETLEGVATAKANAEKNLENARGIFESHLQSVFSQGGGDWLETTIGEQIRFIDYRGKTPVKTTSGIRLITAKNVKMGYLQDAPMEYIADSNYKTWMTRGIPEKGDVLFTTEAPLANVAQLDTAEKVAFAQRIIVMQTKAETLDSTFLKYLLLSQPIQHRIRTKGTGATVQGIKASLLKTIEISFPRSIVEQKRLVIKLERQNDETQRLASIYERKLVALDALKKSLLHSAFAGELTADGTSELIEAVA